MKMRKNIIKTAKTLIINQRFDETDRRYFKSSVWAPSICVVASSTFASILKLGKRTKHKFSNRSDQNENNQLRPMNQFLLMSNHRCELSKNIAKFDDSLFDILHRLRSTGQIRILEAKTKSFRNISTLQIINCLPFHRSFVIVVS